MKQKNNSEEKIEEETPVYEYYYRRHSGGGYIGAFILIFAGAVLLLNNLDLLPWSVWNEIWRLWPVILIIIGFHVLLGKSPAARIFTMLLTLFILAGILAYILISSGILIFPPLR